MVYFWVGLALSTECPALLEQGRIAFEARKLEVAAQRFGDAARDCADKPAALVALSQVQFLLGKEVEAERSLKLALAANPDHGESIYALGRIYYHQHRYQEAVSQFLNLVAMEPRNYRAHDNLALCYDVLNRDADAARHFKRALDLVMKEHPEYDWAHANFADFFLKREKYEEAFQLAAEAARRNPASARNAFLTGKALVKLEKPELALRWLETAVKLDEKHGESWYLLAQLYRRMGRGEDAAAALGRFKEAGERK